MTAVDYWRQLDLVTPSDLDFDVTVIGLGGLGSPIAFALAKMGCPRIALFDPDRVEPHNLPNQLFRPADVDSAKVDAMARMLNEYTGCAVESVPESVVEQPLHGLVVCAVDSMAARRSIWERSVRYRAGILLYIDARMGGEVGRVLTTVPVDPRSVVRYEATLHGDDEASVEPCTAQATIYGTFGVASLVVNQVKRHARAERVIFDQVLDFATSTLITDA